MAGLLTCGSQLSRTFPGTPFKAAQWFPRGRSPPTVAGAVTDLVLLTQHRTMFPFHLAGLIPLRTIICHVTFKLRFGQGPSDDRSMLAKGAVLTASDLA